MNPTKICVHCRKLLVISARGLCSACYHKPAVRTLYLTRRTVPPDAGKPEPTAAELDALVAAQQATMPAERTRPPEPRRPRTITVRYRRGQLPIYEGGYR